MKSLKSRLLSSVGAALLALSVSATAMASWDVPTGSDMPNYDSVRTALAFIPIQITDILTTLTVPVNAQNIKIVYLEDILSGDQLVKVNNTLNNLFVKVQLINLQNTLNGINILNGVKIGDILSNNNVTLKDVVAVNLFDDGKLLVFCK